MTVWLQKTFEFGDYAQDRDRYAELCLSLRHPREMMMISSGSLTSESIYLSLPGKEYAHLFPGWTEVQEASLPKVASGLVCHQDEFEKRFSYPVQFGP